MAPNFLKLAELVASQHIPVNLIALNMSMKKNQKIQSDLGIVSYATFRLYKNNGSGVQFNAQPTVDNLLKFLIEGA